MYDRILVPLDDVKHAEAALECVERLPSRSVCLLRVESNDRHAQRIRDELNSVAERFRAPDRAIDVEIRYGDPAKEIIAAARNADLVVMTTHGRGAARRLLFGSVADEVVREGSAPTLLFRGGSHPTRLGTPTRIVVPLDGSSVAETALPEAQELAEVLGIPLHLVRAVGFDEVLATVRGEPGAKRRMSEQGADYERARVEAERQAGEYLAARADAVRAAGTETSVEVLAETPVFALLKTIKADDIVVMTTHGRGGYQRWAFGSVTEKLVREAAAPILLVRDGTGAAVKST